MLVEAEAREATQYEEQHTRVTPPRAQQLSALFSYLPSLPVLVLAGFISQL